MRRLVAGCLVLAGLLVTGCAGAGRRPPESPAAPSTLARHEASAILLLMSDQLLYEPFGVGRIFRERPDLHERLALVLGQIGDPRGLEYLESLLREPVVEVRRAAAFGIGLLGDGEAYPLLLGALVDPDREVGRLAVDGLTRLEIPLDRILPALDSLPGDERWRRLAPSLFRFSADEIHEVERRLAKMEGVDPEVARWLLYALARSGDRRGLPRLRVALGSADPWVQGWAARALGRVGEGADVDRLRALLESGDPGVVVQALRAGRALVEAGRVAAPNDWMEPLERLVMAEHSWVRLTAIEAAGAWPFSRRLAETLAALASGEDRAAVLALGSLARAGDIESQQLTLRAAASERMEMRRAAVGAADLAGPEEVIERLRDDPEPAVRIAALTALLESARPFAATRAREALLDTDPGVRAVALGWLGSNPEAPIDELLMAVLAASDRLFDVKMNGAAALAARARAEPLERGAIVAALERLASDEQYLVRRAAREALESLDRPAPPLGTVTTSRRIGAYREIARSTGERRRVEIEIEAGTIVVELDCPAAPLACLSFLQLAEAGFYDGLRFHRVIPDFVAQGGDPRGDGWGGPGFSVRDEYSRIEFDRGVAGMARSGTHTAGSQFFLTLSAQPHLTGRYTAFGRVVEGDGLLDSIEQGDSILGIRELSARGGSAGSP